MLNIFIKTDALAYHQKKDLEKLYVSNYENNSFQFLKYKFI